ncbi:cyanophycin synthetase [Runella slithyformis]|uniref:Cyanophycin synthetase n=1 Tax=Runella slithyformis (strain ATCC 29530 / DSM 19594 / LMG 11500 / NCIMB 11436 / LSU 4) TaxID=761193 RepID=A0A7U3ZNS4_RUNSL|nr:cyanophycin synthetase [Runella slithyformis]AEI50602.1 cyanophycin synthetase [Runella slithyformis DSM 19594]
MKIVSVKVLRGPNYWSARRTQLIVMKLDLEEAEELPTNKIPGFAERLEAALPSLYEHRCSEGRPGGFFERVKDGTWLGHVIEHVALELQTLAGMFCGYGRTRSADTPGVYHVVFAYQLEKAGLYAAEAAVCLVEALKNNVPYDLRKDVQLLAEIHRTEGMGPSTRSIIEAAERRQIPYKRLNSDSLILLGQGVHQKLLQAGMTGNTGSIAVELASDKEATRQILDDGFVPVPKGETVSSVEELRKTVAALGFPVVLKPLNANQGKGVTTNIQTMAKAVEAFEKAHTYGGRVIVERFIAGFDFRFLVINYSLVAVAKRTPALVEGNGKESIGQLIDQVNQQPDRGEDHEKNLTKIKVDAMTLAILEEKGLTLASVLPFGELLLLKDTANLSTGGTAVDVTDSVHPSNVFLAERVARLMNLDICGIDIVAEDISQPITEENGAVIEVNACPGFRMHLSPSAGPGRDVGGEVIKMLYPSHAPTRIPVVAVTGTNGKTTTTRLVAHFAKNAGHSVGYTTTDGIYIQDQLIYEGDCSGPQSAEAILRDPSVNFAVLECARGGILRSGLGFDKCNISIITNITEDHLGLDDIHTLEELARVKSVVARSTFSNGYAILNADDDTVYGLREELDCTVALFSVHENNERVLAHCRAGGMAAIIRQGYFTLCRGKWTERIANVNDVPLTFEGRATCMIKNILPSILAAALCDFDTKTIRRSLQSFVPGPEFTPGRMNVFKVRDSQVMIDYVHNTDGFQELAEFMKRVDAEVKVGIIGCAGDRRDEDIIKMGVCVAQMFDKIIIRHDKDGRGRTEQELTRLLLEGIHCVNQEAEITVISDEVEALEYAIDHFGKGAFIVNSSEEIKKSIDFVRMKQQAASHSFAFEYAA